MSKKKQVRTKQITMPKIKKEASSINKTEEYIMNDKNEAIRFYPYFPEGKIDDLLEELREDVLYSMEKGIDLVDDDRFFLEYIYFLCIKHFTSLKKGISDSLENKILQFEYLKDTGYYRQIVEDVFLASELEKVTNALAKLNAVDKMYTKIEQKTEDYVKELEFRNKEVIEKLENRVENEKLNN